MIMTFAASESWNQDASFEYQNFIIGADFLWVVDSDFVCYYKWFLRFRQNSPENITFLQYADIAPPYYTVWWIVST